MASPANSEVSKSFVCPDICADDGNADSNPFKGTQPDSPATSKTISRPRQRT